MPVKKVSNPKSAPRKKSNSKKSSSPKISREERANIKKAVNSLPSLLIEQTPVRQDPPREKETFTPQTKISPPKQETSWNKPVKPIIKVVPPSAVERKKRILLQIVVGAIMIFIGSLWLINIRTKFSDADFNLGSEEKLWQSAKKDFHDVVQQPQEIKTKLKQTVDTAEKLKAEEEVKQALQKNLFLLAATSTSSTLQSTTTTVSATSTTTSTTSTNFSTSTFE